MTAAPAVKSKLGGGARSYSRRAAGPAPSVPHLRWQGTPPVAGACEGVALKEQCSTADGAGPSRTAASDARIETLSTRRQSLDYDRNRGRASPGGGGVGEEQWHG